MTPPAPAPRLSDPLVVLEQAGLHHLDGLQHAIVSSHPELREWMDWAGEEPQSRQTTAGFLRDRERSWADGSEYAYAMTDPDSGEVIGVSSLMRRVGEGALEMGYWVRSDRTGRGVATAAARLLTSAALALADIARVEIHHDVANPASGRVPEKLGYALTDRHDVEIVAPGHTGVNLVWTITSAAATAPRR